MSSANSAAGDGSQSPAQLSERALLAFQLGSVGFTLTEFAEFERVSLNLANEPAELTSLGARVELVEVAAVAHGSFPLHVLRRLPLGRALRTRRGKRA